MTNLPDPSLDNESVPMTLDLEAARARARAAGKLPDKPPPPDSPDSPATLPPQPTSDTSKYADTIADVSYEKSQFDVQMDAVISKLGILEYYKLFCNKMIPDVGSKREGIMISCPKPNHRDEHPSAWLNLDKDIWFCSTCEEGGDGYDIAAYNLNFDVPGYKKGKNFHDLREAIALRLGYTVQRPLGSKEQFLIPPEGTPEPSRNGHAPAPPPAAASLDAFLKPASPPTPDRPLKKPSPPAPDPAITATPAPDATVTALPTEANVEQDSADDSDADRDFLYPSIDWQKFAPTGTFLHAYMTATAGSYIPDEYHFWNGMAALGLAVGHGLVLADNPKPVHGNLFICTVGASGVGKSQATGIFKKLIRQALPYQWDDPTNNGVKEISTPASGEVLISSFIREVPDPNNPKVPLKCSVKGLVNYDEFGNLVARTSRGGNTLGTHLLQFYDSDPYISTSSRTGGDLVAEDAFCTLLSTTQLKSIRELMSAKDQNAGFLNRWIFSMGPYKDRKLFSTFEVDITPAVMPLKKIAAWAAPLEKITCSRTAVVEVLEPWYLKDVKPLIGDEMFSRLGLLIKKLLFLFAVNQHEKQIGVKTAQMVIDIFPYIIATYLPVQERVGSTEEDEIIKAVMHAVKGYTETYGKPPTIRQIGQRLSKNKMSAERLRKTIETLVALERLEIVAPTGTGPGRKAVKYAIPTVS